MTQTLSFTAGDRSERERWDAMPLLPPPPPTPPRIPVERESECCSSVCRKKVSDCQSHDDGDQSEGQKESKKEGRMEKKRRTKAGDARERESQQQFK